MQQRRLSAAKTKVKITIKKGENQIRAEGSKHTLPAPSCSWPSPPPRLPHPPSPQPPPPATASFPSLAHQRILARLIVWSGSQLSFKALALCLSSKGRCTISGPGTAPCYEAAGTTTSTSFFSCLSVLILVSPRRLEVPWGAAPSAGIPCVSHLRMPCTSWVIPGDGGPAKPFPQGDPSESV